MQQRILLAVTVFLLLITLVIAAPRSIHLDKSRSAKASINQTLSETKNERLTKTTMTSENQPMRDYAEGYRLGECLSAGSCQVFIGEIRSKGAAMSEANVDPKKAIVYRALVIAVDEWLLSSGVGNEAQIKLRSASEPAFTKTADGPWTAWENANLAEGGKLLVAIWGEKAQRAVYSEGPEKVALAVSDSRAILELKKIVAAHQRYELSPQEFANVPQEVESSYNNFLVGYVMAYVKRKETFGDVDNAALVLSKLQNNSQIPDYVHNDISYQLLGDFYRMSENSRKAATESLVGAAATDNSNIADSALYVLIRLSNDKRFDMRPFLTPERRLRLIERYQSTLSRNKGVPGHSEFEHQLGLEVPQ